jgi:NADPH:quinone reductase-like Zn-dependent oxidoreductase/acyl carrier protein
MEPMLAEFRRVAERVSFRAPGVPIVSNVTGEQAGEELASAEYWVRHVRAAVRFCDGVQSLEGAGVGRFLELGPDGVLCAMARECLSEQAQERALLVPAMRARRPEGEAIVGLLAEAHTHGVQVDWPAFFAGSRAQPVDLPRYAFQRERYWLEPAPGAGDLSAAGLGNAHHPLLGAAVQVAGRDEWLFTGRLALATHPWLADHAVFDTVLLPGTAFIELALSAGRQFECGGLEELTFEAPLLLAEQGGVRVQVVLAEADESERRAIAIYSSPAGSSVDGSLREGEWTRHASGILTSPAGIDAVERLAGEMWPPAGAEPVEVGLLYDRLAEVGFGYGPAFQGVVAAWLRGEEVFTEVALDEAQAVEAASFGLHPALLDAAGHVVIDRLSKGLPPGRLPLPFSWSGVRLYREGASSLRVQVMPAGGEALRINAFDETGALVFSAESLLTRAAEAGQLAGARRPGQDSLFGLEWAEVPLPSTNGQVRRFVALGDLDAPAMEDRYTDLGALGEALNAGASAPDVVLIAAPARCEEGDLAPAVHGGVQWTLELLQAWLAEERLVDVQLAIVTRGAVSMRDDGAPDLVSAPLWGLVRSAQSEHPGRFLLIDLDDGEVPWQALLNCEESQLVLREGKAYMPQLAPPGDGALLPPAGERTWHLGAQRRETLEDLALMPNLRVTEPLGSHEVRIAVRAAGLNFRDVLIVLGRYPGEAPIGGEGAGVVLEVGSGVSDIAPGDRVMGTMDDAFGPVAVTDRRRVVPMPQGWSFVEAAAVPIAFLTAHYALVDLAQVAPGEALLIHAGAGGVGMAAVQIARHLGAEVFATASPKKWDALRALGLAEDHIASSRDLDFQERFLSVTHGRGVDVVLDALAGEFVDASLELLPRGGRFIEMGKADIRDAEQVASEHPGVRYRAFDLVEAGPERIQAMLVEIGVLFERRVLRYPPIRSWDVRRGVDAFRFLREGRNVGKVVLTVPQPLDPEGTVLVTGGTGGLGVLVARHLAGVHAVRHLLLVSRRGLQAAGARELVAELAALGCEASVVACDVTNRDQLAELVGSIPPQHPLTGIIHAAGVLDDGVIESLTAEQVERVMLPKVDAALHLHELTEDMDLAEFVLFSSVAATLGAPGQGNYAAANAFLDALAQHRRARGLAGQSLAWGLWAQEAGMASGLGENDRARLGRLGIAPLTNELGLELFDAARTVDGALLVPIRLDTAALRAQARAGMLPAPLRGLVRTRAQRTTQAGSLASRLAAVSEAERTTVVFELVRSQVAAVLGHGSADAVDPRLAFMELGVDSLAAVELRNRLSNVTGLRLPTTLIFDHPSVAAVAEFLRVQVQGDGALDPREAKIRRAIASIPLSRLQNAGLLDTLLELASANGGRSDGAPADGDGDRGGAIDSMDVEGLVQRALQADHAKAGDV